MHAAQSMTQDERNRRTQVENEKRWRKRAEAEKDAIEQNVQDAYSVLAQINGLNLEQSLAGAIFDMSQRIRRLREALDAVVRCSMDGEAENCLICGTEGDPEYRHTEDCPVLAAEKVLNEISL